MKNSVKLGLLIFFASIIGGVTPLWSHGIYDCGLDQAASVGIYVVDLKSGVVIDEYQPQRALTPASIMKTLTVATAMRILGSDYRFETPVHFVGNVTGGVFKGKISVSASGDPTIDSQYFKDHINFCDTIVSHLKTLGVKKFVGTIAVDQSAFGDVGVDGWWHVNDVPWNYSAPFYGFNYADNVVSVNIRKLKTIPADCGMIVKRGTKTGDFELVRGTGSDVLWVNGDITGRSAIVETPVPDPTELFKSKLISGMKRAGINFTRSTKGIEADTIDTYLHYSPLSQEIYTSLMHRSDNMMADAMQHAISDEKTLNGAIKREVALWDSLGVKLDPVRLYDGSGLVRTDAITPRVLGEVLAYMATDSNYVATFPVAGVDGTVKNLLKKTRLSGRLALKSGSMTAVRCYAGYKLDDEGTPSHVVVLMVNQSFLKGSELRRVIERYLLSLF